MLTKGTKAYEEVLAASLELREGHVLCIDPSIGSESSQPGWAYYYQGTLRGSGTIAINPNASTPARLQLLNYGMRKLIQAYGPDVLVYENITDIPYKGFSGRGHAPLLKALGAILSVSGPEKYVGILARSWKSMVRDSYRKGDENDAIELGWVLIQEAHRLHAAGLDEKGKKRRNGKVGKKRKRKEKNPVAVGE